MSALSSTFNGKVAIITGGAQGLGRALARQLSEHGVILGLIDKRTERLETTAAELRASTTVEAFHADVRDADAVEAATARMCEAHGQLDFFFNNAGVGILGEARDHELDDWREVVDTNLYGTIHGVCAAYPRMIAQQHGHIVNVGSMAGVLPVPGNIAYVASKGGVMSLTLALRSEAALHGVRVTLVTPMAVSTNMLAEAKSLRLDREAVREAFVGPAITPEACAHAILRGVVRNKAVVRPHLAWPLWTCSRFFPFVLQLFYGRVARTVAALRQPEASPADRRLESDTGAS